MDRFQSVNLEKLELHLKETFGRFCEHIKKGMEKDHRSMTVSLALKAIVARASCGTNLTNKCVGKDPGVEAARTI